MRHFTRDRSPFRVRLACVKHAASVQSEPESNSPVQICSKDLRWTEIRISKFLPVRYSLVNEPHRFTRREAVVYAASFSLSTNFFHFAKVFFRGPVGATRWREGDLCLIFKPASRTFLPSGKISFPVALSDVASSLARTALCAFSTPPSSIFPQKILRISSSLTGYSINMPKRHRKILGFFFTLFHFLLPFLPGKNHTFPARESIIVSPGNDAPLSPCFGFSLSRHQRTHRKEKNTPDTAPRMRH